MSGEPVPVSVVVPCYRCAATIGRSLESVFAQSRPPAELIVADDASDDDSLGAVARAAGGRQRPPQLRTVVLSANRGPADARNAAWATATQPYVAFLDADDAWHPRKLELQHAWMEANPDSLLCGHAIAGEVVPDAAIRSATRVTPAMLLASNRFQTSSVMLRRSVAQRFAGGKRHCEDYLLWLEMVLAGAPAHYLEAPLAVRFKPVYGASGASGRLWAMERGELDALARVRRSGLLGAPGYLAASAWSWLKFLRRVALARAR